jgi:hypothetical protein
MVDVHLSPNSGADREDAGGGLAAKAARATTRPKEKERWTFRSWSAKWPLRRDVAVNGAKIGHADRHDLGSDLRSAMAIEWV